MSTTKSENAFKHPQQQVQLMEFSGDEQRRQQTSCNTTNVVVEESTNGCVTLTALEKEKEVEEIDEVEQHTQMTTNDTYICKEKSEVNAAELAVTPAAVMVMNEAPETTPTTTLLCGKKLLFCRRFKDYGGILRNFNSLPLFVYATSPSTHAISADGVGVAKEAVAAADAICQKNDSYDLALCPTSNSSGFGTATAIIGAMECLPIMNGGGSSSNSSGLGTLGIGGAHHIMSSGNSSATVLGGVGSGGGGSTPTVTVVGSYQQHLANLHAAHHPHLNLIGHHHAVTPYSNNYPLHHSSSHHHIQSEQTKSLQELQHEVGALLEFRDLVIETFPDLKHKMASMSSSSTATSTTTAAAGGNSVSGANTLTGGGGGSVSVGQSNASLVSRREWEPGIRLKRKVSQKEPSTATASATVTVNPAAVAAGVIAGELSSSSLTRSRSNSHSGKKEPKSGENNNGSVVQDSGFSTETSSSKEGHSASSTNGAMTGPAALNRLSCHESDDELLNLLDVIHRKSSRLREEMDQLQRYERQNLRGDSNTINANNNTNPPTDESTRTVVAANELVTTPVTTRSSSVLAKSSSSGGSSNITVNGAGLTPKTFREHVERLNKEDIKQLRKERDRLLDKLAEMEAETLTGRIKAAKMNDQVEELITVKKDLEEQLKLAMAQKLDLSARVQQLQQQQQQQQQLQSKSSSSQSDYSSQRNFLSSAATTVLSTGSTASVQLLDPTTTNLSTQATAQSRRQHTFQPVVVVDGLQQSQQHHRLFHPSPAEEIHNAFHQSAGSDNKSQQSEQSLPQQQQQRQALGRLDGIVSQPGGRLSKCRMIDSKRFAAILLETSAVELQRHLLTLTVQNQVLMQKLDSATKSKSHLAKRLDKSKDDVEDLRFQLEEKNIELEGTKAQLRVLESRIHSVTPSSGAPTNSYLHSQNDYETNRSSASTTLMLSRRGIGDIQYSDMRSATPISVTTATSTTTNAGQMPAPPLTQISTPSMKAMVHLPMDELQQHSSSTESAHDHELHESGEHAQTGSSVNRLMSASVGGVSPFDSVLRGKKVSMGSKPSKIPLPGSKAAAYFAGKPPSGRPSTAGRSPPSTHTYAASNSSSKSSLCRSTGNLLYSKSPNSLKRADSAQSIRKDNSSLSTNTSRSSTSSSIPLATHHLLSNATSKSPIGATAALTPTPSPRILQNSPLPKLKRESLTSRVRHLDSLSRVHQHNQNQHSNISNGGSGGGGSDVSCTSPTSNNQNNSNSSLLISSSSPTSTTTHSYIVSSTPKPSAIAAHLNATLRKDLQLNTNSYGAQQFLRRATGGGSASSANSSTASVQSVVNNSATVRRFSSASVVGARIANRSQSQDAGSGEQSQQQQTSDSDSGKELIY